jgi:hypothetical protein
LPPDDFERSIMMLGQSSTRFHKVVGVDISDGTDLCDARMMDVSADNPVTPSRSACEITADSKALMKLPHF